MQTFVQTQWRHVIGTVAAKKKKEDKTRIQLMAIRSISADWAQGGEPSDSVLNGDKKKTLRSKKDETDHIPEISHRSVGPNLGQLILLRSTIFGLLSENFYKGVVEKKRWAKLTKDISCADILKGEAEKHCQDFYDRSFFYPYALAFGAAVRIASDLGDIWYKEFYLELDKKRLQFPITMSLPWILTNHVLESTADLSDSLLFPLSLYNDAASRAVDHLRRQFLFNEIEAEVNLAFDQLIYKVSSQVWEHHKMVGSCSVLDSKFTDVLHMVDPTPSYVPKKYRWSVIAQQRHLQLLGRSIDVNALMTERLTNMLRKNIDYAIARFEAMDLTSVIELQTHLEVLRITHASLLDEGFALPPFDDLLAEVDESTSMVSFHGRIAFHIIYELVYDFFVMFNFNGVTKRFVPAEISVVPDEAKIVRSKMPARKPMFIMGSTDTAIALGRIFGLYKKFFGQPHLEAIVSLLRFNMPLIFTEVRFALMWGCVSGSGRERSVFWLFVVSWCVPSLIQRAYLVPCVSLHLFRCKTEALVSCVGAVGVGQEGQLCHRALHLGPGRGNAQQLPRPAHLLRHGGLLRLLRTQPAGAHRLW